MLQVESNLNDVRVSFKNIDNKELNKDFLAFVDIVSKFKKIPFHDIYFMLPTMLINQFFEFIQQKNLKYKELQQNKDFLIFKF
jgi:hypothetical protein